MRGEREVERGGGERERKKDKEGERYCACMYCVYISN